MAQQRYRRRQKIVDAKFQLQLGLHLIGWLYLYVVVVAVAVNLPALKALVLADASESEYIEAILFVRSFSRFVLVPLIVTFIAMALHAIVLTHRIAGPMYRVKAVLRDMAQRRFPEAVTFRTKDYLHDVAAEMSVTTQALREDQQRMLRMNEETTAAARRLAEVARSGVDREHLVRLADEVVESAGALQRHIASAADERTDTETQDTETATSRASAPDDRVAALDV